MAPVVYSSHPKLDRPVLIAAFEGWNDAGDAASTAIEHLTIHLDATEFAHLDAEEFYDFTVRRPRVYVDSDGLRRIEWPHPVFTVGRDPGSGRHVVLLTGYEPSVKWRTFCESIVLVARETGCSRVYTLGALLSNVPHTRPTPILGVASTPELMKAHKFEPSNYSGPTGIVGALLDTCRKSALDAVSLWAQVPWYLQANPSPAAALALIQRVTALIGIEIPTADLVESSKRYVEEVSEAVGSDPDVAARVKELEQEADANPFEVPTGDELAAEVERYLRERNEE